MATAAAAVREKKNKTKTESNRNLANRMNDDVSIKHLNKVQFNSGQYKFRLELINDLLPFSEIFRSEWTSDPSLASERVVFYGIRMTEPFQLTAHRSGYLVIALYRIPIASLIFRGKAFVIVWLRFSNRPMAEIELNVHDTHNNWKRPLSAHGKWLGFCVAAWPY